MRFALALTILAALAGNAAAHDLRPGVLSIVELDDDELTMRFTPPVDSRGEPTDVRVELPPGCAETAERVHCERGFAGELAVLGMSGDSMRTVVSITRRDGDREEWLLTAAEPRITIGQSPPSAVRTWIWIGIEHILGGPDHVAFVIGLLLVLRAVLDRRLLWTLTAFTLAHSLTLALSVLDIVRLSIAPVEACIALSVLLVAREATHDSPTVLRRWPWLVAGGFGLIHGLGFASALGDVGLPRASVATSLVWFNVGVEIGQLAIVGTVMLLVWLGRLLVRERGIVGPWVHRAACYVLGAVSAKWLVERVVDLARGGS